MCRRCGSNETYHITPYPDDSSPGEHGILPLCEACWRELSPEERLPWYRQLWDIWNTGGFWIQYHDGTWHEWPRCVSWPVIEEAVLSEGIKKDGPSGEEPS